MSVYLIKPIAIAIIILDIVVSLIITRRIKVLGYMCLTVGVALTSAGIYNIVQGIV